MHKKGLYEKRKKEKRFITLDFRRNSCRLFTTSVPATASLLLSVCVLLNTSLESERRAKRVCYERRVVVATKLENPDLGKTSCVGFFRIYLYVSQPLRQLSTVRYKVTIVESLATKHRRCVAETRCSRMMWVITGWRRRRQIMFRRMMICTLW